MVVRLVAARLLVALVAGLVLTIQFTSGAADARALRGVALVIGQSAYEHIPALPNPGNDAREMLKLLTDLGFDTRGVTDRDAVRLRRDLERFAEDAEDADVAFLYYSGHGIEAGGENWLLPVDVDQDALGNAAGSMVGLSALLDELRRNVAVTIVLLDACRTNPFPPGTLVRPAPSAEPVAMGDSGLTPVRGAQPLGAPRPGGEALGTVIGFAAEPGLPALDGDPGGNSPYAAALLRHLSAMPGIEFGSVMRMVTEEVYLATATRQRPWVNESLRRQLFFGATPASLEGEAGLITGERRQLLLTIAELPDINRVQVEQVAARDGVPLDALYGILRALDETARPRDPSDLERMLEAQADRLRRMLGERAALRTDDPEIMRLSDAADRAIAEGAIQTARLFMDQAVARVEETRDEVDDLEDLIRQKRIADAAIYARRADAAALAFAFLEAAADYALAFELIEKWDATLAWNYKNLEAEALHGHGGATGDRAALDAALLAYEMVLRMLPPGDRGRDWAITRNNMAVVLQTIGERRDGSEELDQALAIFEEAMEVFTALGDDANRAAARNNVGGILLTLGQRDGSSVRIEQAIEAYRGALELRDRETVPHDWASTQNNLGIALFLLHERNADPEWLARAEAAYRAALEVFTRDTAPVDWGMTQNNLGNTLDALGLQRNDPALHEAAVVAFEAALTVRDRETWPLQWAATQLNLGNAYSHLSRHEPGVENLERAREAYQRTLTVFSRRATPLDWASAKNNLGSVLQTLGQRGGDTALLAESIEAFQAARQIYRRGAFPLDWAMTQHNVGNTHQLLAGLSGDPRHYRLAIAAFREALREFTRERAPLRWAHSMAGIGSALQGLAHEDATLDTLRESIATRRQALEVFSADNAPIEWATALNGLGTTLLNLSTLSGDPATLDEALAAFQAAQQVFTREAQPLQWAFAQNNIGDVHWNRAARGGGRHDYLVAMDLFESAKQAFGESGHYGAVMLSEQKIGLIRQALGEE